VNNVIEHYPSFLVIALTTAFLLPLISFLISLMVSEKYSWVVSILSPFLLFISGISAFIVFLNIWDKQPFLYRTEWFHLGGLVFPAGVFVNNISALMLAVVCIISFLVHLYSIGYMAGDEGERRYFGMLGLFTFAMLGIVLADNLLIVFVFWELVGFSSYMLIGHWKEKPEAAAASKKAFLLNRIGDAGFLIGLMILWSTGQGFYLPEFRPVDHTLLNTIAALCLFGGVLGKSAQFPLLTWLPDAMEGPTPVSALIHAATMVAAGVFLLARVFILFTPEALLIVAVVGMITAILAGFAALVQTDIKKILAYSTISQLGLMVTAVGAGAWEAAMLHLFTHAFFKACLFLCAGSVIHVLHQAQHQAHLHFDVQDIRNLGGLRKKLPFTFIAVLISGSALAGLPLFSGFLSKEAILSALMQWKGDEFNGKWIIFGLAFTVSFLTVLYMSRFLFRIFLGKETATTGMAINEPPQIMRAPITLLALASLWFVVSPNPIHANGWIFPSAEHSTGLTLFSSAWVIFAGGLAFLVLNRNAWLHSDALYNAFYLDRIYHYVVVTPVLSITSVTERMDRLVIDRLLHGIAYLHVTLSHLAGWFDRAIVDGSVNGFASIVRTTGSFTRSFQGGKIQLYVFWALFAIIIFLIWSLI
jgi:NADH-quinone oxidoreductase subunit L